MEPLRTLVVGADLTERADLQVRLRDETACTLVGDCSADEATVFAARTSPDLAFFSLTRSANAVLSCARTFVQQSEIPTVLVASDARHALTAFEVRAFDYLLDPLCPTRLRSTLMHAHHHRLERRAQSLSRQLLRVLPSAASPDTVVNDDGPRPPERLGISAKGRTYFVSVADIDWCDAAGNYVRLHTGTETHLLRTTMARLMTQLCPRRFLRIHRKTLVNTARVRELRSSGGAPPTLVLRDGTRLTVARSYASICRSQLFGDV